MGKATELRTLSTAKSLIRSQIGRTSLALRNADTAIDIKFGERSDVDGFTLSPKEKAVFNKRGGSNPEEHLYVWAASGTPSIEILEEFA